MHRTVSHTLLLLLSKDKGPKPLTCHQTNIKTIVRRNVKQSKSNKQQCLAKNDELSPPLKLRKFEKSVLLTGR